MTWQAQSGSLAAQGAQTITISITSTSLSPGTYSATISASGASANGDTNIYVTYNVAANPCSASLSASPNPVNYGSGTRLSWSSSNGSSIVLSGGQFGGGTGVAASGIWDTNGLTSATSYTLTVSGGCSPTASSSVTVSVNPPCVISSFTASPSTVNYGAGTNLNWTSSGCSSATLSGGQYGGGVGASPVSSGGASTSGLYSTTTYTFSVSGNGTSDSRQVTVYVNGPCTLSSFDASPSTVNYNGTTILSWSSSSSCTSATLAGGQYGGGVGVGTNSSTTTTNLTSSTGYTIYVYGPTTSDSRSLTVNVTPPCAFTSPISASPSTVEPGGSSTLSWSTSNCSSATLNGGGTSVSGSTSTGALYNATAYTLVASGPGNSVSSSVTVSIYCRVSSFTASPSSINYNATSTLGWSASSGCSSAVLSGGQWGGGVGTSPNSGATTNALTSTTTYTFSVSGNSSDSRQVTVTVAAPCTISSFYASPNPIPYNTSSSLYWTTNSCTSVSISGGQFGGGTAMSPVASGSVGTNNLISSTSYGISASGPGNSSSSSTSVSVGAACTINVNHTYNGIPGALPSPGTFSMSLSGPANRSGSGAGSYSFAETPSAQNWTAVYTGDANGVFVNYTPAQSQSCNAAGGSITFTLNFQNYPPGPPSTPPVAQNSATNGAVGCGRIRITWGAGTNAVTSYNIYRSTNPSVPGGVWQTTTGLTMDDTSPDPDTTYYYWVQSVSPYGTSSQSISNAVSVTSCIADFNLSDIVFKQVNGSNYSFNSNCVASQTGTVRLMQAGDRVTSQLCLVNNGTVAANNVSVRIDTSVSNLENPRNFVLTGGSSRSSSVSGNVITINFGTIDPANKGIATFDTDVKTPPAGSQQLQRIRLQPYFTYDTGATPPFPPGCRSTIATLASPCNLDSGFIIYYGGSKSPSQKEINP